jgi:hypothetical protein
MSLSRCNLALKKLADFHITATSWNDDKERELDNLIRLAFNFTNELRAAGMQDVLASRTARFAELTKPEGEIDQGRQAASAVVVRLDVYFNHPSP